jgi:DNA-binding transcriptional LysR family regulator
VNISQLEYLIATIDLGSYARAAKSLYVTPQAVAKGISDLERELKIKLFVKSGRGIEATSDGALLATKIIQSCEDLKRYANVLACSDERAPLSRCVSLSPRLPMRAASSRERCSTSSQGNTPALS